MAFHLNIKMRRSRTLSFKKDNEQQLKSILYSKKDTEPVKKEEPQTRNLSEVKISNRDVKRPQTATRERKVEFEEDLEQDTEEKYNDDFEEEESVKKNVKQQKKKVVEEPVDQEDDEEPKIVEKSRKVEALHKKPTSTPRRGSPKRQTKSNRRSEEEEEEQEMEERGNEDEHSERKRRNMIVSRPLFLKFVNEAGLESAASDIQEILQVEMVNFIMEVIKMVGGNEEQEDEIVVKESNLRFLGDKNKSIGVLDMKTFEKLFGEAEKNISSQVHFTSESFKSLCKYTEIHIIDFLKKARAIMVHCGRKRLNFNDVELLKFLLE